MSEPRQRALPWILVGVFGTLWVTKGASAVPDARVVDETPKILQSIRHLGFLQTAEMNLSDSFQFASSKSPEGAVAAVPGMTSLVQAVTKNTVWVQASGKVTAGVDLSKARVRIEADSVHVHLPQFTVQPSQVDLKLLNDKKGLFWKDDEILLKAIREARTRFNSTADQLRIQKTAFAGAEKSIRKLLRDATAKAIIIE